MRGLFLRFRQGFLPKVLLLSAALTFSVEPINYMGMGTVQALRLSDAGFLKKLRVIVKDSDRVVAIERQEDGELAVVVTVMK